MASASTGMVSISGSTGQLEIELVAEGECFGLCLGFPRTFAFLTLDISDKDFNKCRPTNLAHPRRLNDQPFTTRADLIWFVC